jgi:hypothetical protein
VGQVARDAQHLAGADVDDLVAVLPETKSKPALEDVRQLLVVVRVLGDDASLLQVDVRDHQVVAGDDAPAEQRVQLLAREGVPAVVRRAIRHDAQYGPLGDVRLLRHADRLERRHRP